MDRFDDGSAIQKIEHTDTDANVPAPSYSQLEQAAKKIDVIVDNYNTTGALRAVDYFYGISSISFLILGLASYIKLVQLPVRNVIAYLSLDGLKQRQAIENILREMLGAIQCSRICVGIFHNGTTIGSIHFHKMSVLYEVTAPGISQLRYVFKDVDVIKLEDEIKLTSKDRFTLFARDSVDEECKTYMDSVNIQKILARRLETHEGIFGLFEAQWVDEDRLDIMNDRVRLAQLDSLFSSLFRILNYIRKGKKIPRL